jgi:hypothetical protein
VHISQPSAQLAAAWATDVTEKVPECRNYRSIIGQIESGEMKDGLKFSWCALTREESYFDEHQVL